MSNKLLFLIQLLQLLRLLQLFDTHTQVRHTQKIESSAHRGVIAPGVENPDLLAPRRSALDAQVDMSFFSPY